MKMASVIAIVCFELPHSLHLIHLTVPAAVEEGAGAELTCSYKTSPGEYIDSIKWYHNSSEIYRIVPGLTTHRVMTFSKDGLEVDLPRSGLVRPGTHRLALSSVDRRAAGRFVCQVTESRPPFRTEEMGSQLRVVVSPERGPVLTGLEAEYETGSQVTALCSTAPAFPQPTIRWSINHKQLAGGDRTECKQSNGTQLLWTCLSYLSVLLPSSSSSLSSASTLRCTVSPWPNSSATGLSTVGLLRVSKGGSNAKGPILGVPLISNSSRAQSALFSALHVTILFLSPLLELLLI